MAKFLVQATWDDAPHLTQEAKDELWASIPAYQRDARSKGIPALGSGAIYPISENDIVVADFPIPEHWPRAYGMDVGWSMTAACWGALDRQTDVIYLYAEHYRSAAEAVVHADAIKRRGEWIEGAVDPAARGRSLDDGRRVIDMYRQLGLRLAEADNAVEAGIYQLFMRMSTGRLKVFRSMQHWLSEFRIYRRDEKGKVVKFKDHLMDSTRYLWSCGRFLDMAKCAPAPPVERTEYVTVGTYQTGWMG